MNSRIKNSYILLPAPILSWHKDAPCAKGDADLNGLEFADFLFAMALSIGARWFSAPIAFEEK